MSDPNAKKLKSAKRYINALALIKQGLQLNQWSMVKVEEGLEVYVIGKPEMVHYLNEVIHEAVRPQVTGPSQTGSSELGASSKDDSEASHAEVSLPKIDAGVDSDELQKEGPKITGTDS